MTYPISTASQQGQPHGIGHTETCSFCGGKSWNKKSTYKREYKTYTGSIYDIQGIVMEDEVTTWECANRDCRRMMQTERNLGWKTT